MHCGRIPAGDAKTRKPKLKTTDMPGTYSSPQQTSIVIFTLGGTILMAQDTNRGAGIAPSKKAMHQLSGIVADNLSIETRPLFQLASGSLSFSNLYDLACAIETAVAEGSGGIVVVQGTDTLEETAYAIDLMLRPDIPIVFTGAMRASDAAGADGPANIADAIATAHSPAANGAGVLVVMGSEIHAARLVAKTHSFLPHAFSSPGYGPLGTVREGRADIALTRTAPDISLGKFGRKAPPVFLHSVSLGDDGRILHQLPKLGYAGVVIAGFGAGHVPEAWLADVRELAHAIPVALCSRTVAGAALTRTYGYPGGEISLIESGLIPCTRLTAVKARILLTALLENDADRATIIRHFRHTV